MKCIPLLLFILSLFSNMAINKDLLHKAMLKNCTTYFEQTKDLRNVDALRDREHVLKVLLHSDAMTELPQSTMSSKFISKQLGGVSRKLVHKCRNSKVPFKAFSQKPRKKYLRKSAFIYNHNDLCQKMVNFWLENSVPSPNKRDVKIQHSEKPGDHERVRDPTGASFSLNCKTQKCRTAQRRCDNCFLMFAMHIHVNMAIMNRKFELLYACMVMNACRYANGMDYRVYLKFINTYKDTVPNLKNLVKQWRFREFKPFQICKAKQQ